MRSYLLLVGSFLCIASCSDGIGSASGAKVDKGEYEIIIEFVGGGSGGKTLKGMNVSTNWVPASGLVYLGTDATEEPLGTLTLMISDLYGVDAGVSWATLSTTEVRVGTAEELQARLYELAGDGDILNIEVGANFVRGTLDLGMQRVLNYPDDEPEFISVTGTFTAKSK